jgi:hypothetical protein
MRYAKLIKFGGDLVDAADVTYADYYGGFQCPECNEAVFLRKESVRRGLAIRAAFVHHRALLGVSACENRVGLYSTDYVRKVAAKARNQRLNKLRTSIWNHVLSSDIGDFTDWRKIVKLVEASYLHNELAKLAEITVQTNLDTILDDFFDVFERKFFNMAVTIPEKDRSPIEKFVSNHKKDWRHHAKLSKEAMEFFIKSPQFKYLRKRLFCLLVYPKSFKQLHPRLQQWDVESPEWGKAFTESIALGVCMTFLLIDWAKIFNLAA